MQNTASHVGQIAWILFLDVEIPRRRGGEGVHIEGKGAIICPRRRCTDRHIGQLAGIRGRLGIDSPPLTSAVFDNFDGSQGDCGWPFI